MQVEQQQELERLRAQLAEAQQEFINLKKGEQAASDRAERALLGEATREDCEDTFALDVQELFKRAEAAEQQLAEAQLEQARQRVIGHGEGQLHAIADVNAGLIDDMIAPRLAAAEQQRDALQVENADILLKDRVKTNEINILTKENRELAAERDALLGRLAQIEQGLRDWPVTTVHSATGVDVPMVLMNPAKLQEWADTLRDLRVRSTPRQEPT